MQASNNNNKEDAIDLAQKQWKSSVYALYKILTEKIGHEQSVEKDAAFSYLGTVLSAIRKGQYEELTKDPEEFGTIPNFIFQRIENYVDKNPILLQVNDFDEAITSSEKCKEIETALAQNSLEPFASIIAEEDDVEESKKTDKKSCLMM